MRRVTTTAPARKPRVQAVLTVHEVDHLTDHLVRVHLGGPGVEQLRHNTHTDKYVKIRFGDEEPVNRTYTVRRWDTVAGVLTIDFIVHGDEGIAGPWANAAQPGDELTMSGAGGGYSPNLDADWFLLVGDDTALPAISAAVEALPLHARGHVIVEVDSAQDELLPPTPQGVTVTWLHRHGDEPGRTSLLPEAVQAVEWPDAGEDVIDVFAHGEREAMKALRDVFFAQRGLPRAQVSLSGYWAYGRTEDRFQAEKREPIGQILPPE